MNGTYTAPDREKANSYHPFKGPNGENAPGNEYSYSEPRCQTCGYGFGYGNHPVPARHPVRVVYMASGFNYCSTCAKSVRPRGQGWGHSSVPFDSYRKRY